MSRIVVIHNNPSILALISQILQNLGHQVVTANNEQEGKFLCMLWHPVDGVVRDFSLTEKKYEFYNANESIPLAEGEPLFNATSLFNHQSRKRELEFITQNPVWKVA
ncbi:MAG: hypothetical protein G8345_19945 [Magnetococcales bacterium]|nr:hypothetical protein [Magnetococcales bacterium]NGZ29144.1 hypothetical protein [Magnetococcales bacterium]